MLRRLADNRDPGSLATRLRRKRFALLLDLLEQLQGEIRLLDVGGSSTFWQVMGFENRRVSVTLMNRTASEFEGGVMRAVVGDARDMRQFRTNEFDVVFSNSVIEHVGSFKDQQAMASEVKRVGKRYFIQTPNRYFPIEPHFLVPGFQFLPDGLRAALHSRFNLGWWKRAATYEAALAEVRSIRLLTRKEFARLFPEATMYRERFAGLTKSFIVYHGW